jgi:UDP-N-acetylmuramate dehydrogenase
MFPVSDGKVKLSAAWLIDNAGFHKGYSVPGSSKRASLSTKHTLAITNRGGASSKDIQELATTIKQGVFDKYGIRLVPEPTIIGFCV